MLLTHKPVKNKTSITHLAIVAGMAFSGIAFWLHHLWLVMSREREVLVLWRHIRRLFLHAQIGAKLVFTGE